jgi:hypothetical protein
MAFGKKKAVKDVIPRPPTVQDICDKNTNYVSAYQYTYCDKTITQKKALKSDFIKLLNSLKKLEVLVENVCYTSITY